jgi:hypothetical protein
MEASRATTGMLEVLATSRVRSIRGRPVWGVLQFGHELQHVGELVAALAAAHVDDDLGVAPAGDLLLQHGLASAEGAGDGRLAALQQGVEGIQDALPGEQGLHRVVAPPERPRGAHRPAVEQMQLLDAALIDVTPEFHAADHLLDGVIAFRRQFHEFAVEQGRHQDAVLDGFGFLHRAQHVAASHGGCRATLGVWHEMPALVPGAGKGQRHPGQCGRRFVPRPRSMAAARRRRWH